MGTAAWLVVAAALNQLQTCSPSRRRLIWHEEALLALALATPPIVSYRGPHLGPITETAQNQLLGAAFCKGKLCSGSNLSPNASWLRIAALAYFSPRLRLPIEPRRLWAASGSVGTAAWLGVSAA